MQPDFLIQWVQVVGRDFLDKRADQSWPALAELAGLSVDRYWVAQSWFKSDRDRDHLVRLYRGSDVPSVVFKQVTRPDDPGEFTRILTAQDRVAQGMQGIKGFGAPEILAFDADSRAMLMQAAPGRTVHDLMSNGVSGTDCLRRSGRWMAAFHSAMFDQDRVFQPRYMRNHLTHLLDQIDSGEIQVPARRVFQGHAQTVVALAENYIGQNTKSAMTHGDMNLRNILLEGQGGTGIDFSANHYAPVGFDIARFLLHFAGLFVDIAEVPKGHVLPPRYLAAFFEGYDLVSAEDVSVQYLLRVRVLSDWASMPAKTHRQTMRQIMRLQQLKSLARVCFG